MGNAVKKLERALIKKSFQDGFIQGIRLLSKAIDQESLSGDYESIKKLENNLIQGFLQRTKKLEESKQPEYIFAEHRRAYIDHLEARGWKQQDYIYLREADQLGGTISPIVHYVGNYSNNPKYDAVRKMERARTFKNKGE